MQAIVAEAVKSALASYSKEHRNDQAVYSKEEYVTLLYIGAIADGTVVSLGKLGQINKAGATRDIPKKEFLQGMTYSIEKMLESRALIVVNGLTQEERERYGLDYKEGELLTQEAFYKLLNYSDSEITSVFRKLCVSIVAWLRKCFCPHISRRATIELLRKRSSRLMKFQRKTTRTECSNPSLRTWEIVLRIKSLPFSKKNGGKSMNFKTECNVFLDKMVEMRNALTDQAVNEEIARLHIPYATELNANKEKLIAEAKAEYERNVEAMAALLQSKINQYNSETEAAISAHKMKIKTSTENAMKAKFDAFILGTSELVDKSGIE
jgi:hypothetical protein